MLWIFFVYVEGEKWATAFHTGTNYQLFTKEDLNDCSFNQSKQKFSMAKDFQKCTERAGTLTVEGEKKHIRIH